MRYVKEPLVYEDQLPEMSQTDYDAWFKLSSVVDGVRMGPALGSRDPAIAQTEGMESVMFIRCMPHRGVAQLNNTEQPGECGECVRRDAVLADRASLAFLISAIPVVTGEQFQRFITLDEFREQVLGLVLVELKEHVALRMEIKR